MLVTTWIKVFGAGYDALGLFMYHPPLNVLALCVFAFGIWTLQPSTHPRTKQRGLARHQIIMLGLGIPVLLAGTGILVYAKFAANRAHGYTLHGKLAIFAELWLVAQVVLGGGSVWFNGKLFGRDPKRMWKWHRASGYALFLVFNAVLWLGVYYTSPVLTNSSSFFTLLVVYNIAPLAVMFGIYSRARLSKMPLW
ncbi:hypothetical protein EXIGLDRAFT_299763 [Exidia glandulosa HHB12029]|uniref:Cytochrome b561 domain-containing protein n=1 Tax=Exidia glandulosa HHB12029 TaxID=1314781 RepID=A0A165D9L2_EXIGL|nr:hypothetical protein EXIGLDRAFT_299763 [Exidia glandulosa HHB12029]